MQMIGENQRRELEETGETRFVDPATNARYVVVKEELFDRLKKHEDEVRATYAAALRAWDQDPDPELHAYQKCRRAP